jgi:hypothetical protein
MIFCALTNWLIFSNYPVWAPGWAILLNSNERGDPMTCLPVEYLQSHFRLTHRIEKTERRKAPTFAWL